MQNRLGYSGFYTDAWPAIVIRDTVGDARAPHRVGRRQVHLSRARPVHRPAAAPPAERAAGVEDPPLRRAAGAGLPRLFAGAARRLQHPAHQHQGDPHRPEHHHSGRPLPGRRHQRAGAALRFLQRRERDRRRHHDPHLVGAAGLSPRHHGHVSRLPDAAPLPQLRHPPGRGGAAGSAIAPCRSASRCGTGSRSTRSAGRSTRHSPRWQGAFPPTCSSSAPPTSRCR